MLGLDKRYRISRKLRVGSGSSLLADMWPDSGGVVMVTILLALRIVALF